MAAIIPVAVSLFGAPGGQDPVQDPRLNQTWNGLGDSLRGVAGAVPGLPATVATPVPFADLLTEAVGQVEDLDKKSKVAIEGLLSGKGVDVHEAMIAAQKAGMGFELMLSVRNKALAAYQQVMGMQF